MPHLSRVPKIWIHGGDAELEITMPQRRSTRLLDRMDGSPLTAEEREPVTINDRALLIYTSGTTGLPKAASISHRRILNWGGWFAGLTDAIIRGPAVRLSAAVSQRRRHRRAMQHAERGSISGAVGQSFREPFLA